jgi:hypothetical protein
MSEFNQALLISNLYRCLLIIAGICFAYWGYRLFDKGYFEKGGELKAKFGENHLLLKQVAPGVFFAALGALAIAIGVARGISISVPSSLGTSVGTMKFPKKEPCPTVGVGGVSRKRGLC